MTALPSSLRRGRVQRPDVLALGVLLTLTLAALLWMGRDTLPIFDDWIFWADEPSFAPGYLLDHYAGHASPVVKAIWNLLTELTGGDSFVPYRMYFNAIHLAILALFYFVVAPFVGRGLALVSVLPLTLMGSAWLDYVMPISGIYQAVGVLGLLAALVALERGTLRGDVVACLALLAVTFSAVSGTAAIAGAFVWLLWPQPRPQWRRLWVAVVPTVLFGLWYATYSPDGENQLQPIDDASLVPGYITDGFSSGVRTVTYLPMDWSKALAAGLVLLVVWLAARGRMNRVLAAAVAGGLAYWAVIAIGRGPDLRVDQYRYLYANGAHAFLVAVLALGVTGLRSSRRTVLVLGAVALAFFIPTADQLRRVFGAERQESIRALAAISAVELAPERAPGDLNPIYPYREDDGFTVDRYSQGLRQGRSFGWSPSELPGLSAELRRIVDATLPGVLQLKVEPAAAAAACRTQPARREVPAPVGRPVVVRNTATAEARFLVRRFADRPTEIGKVAPGTAATLTIPRDRSPRPWLATLSTPFAVCR